MTGIIMTWNPETGGKSLLNDSCCSTIAEDDSHVEGGRLVLRSQTRKVQGQSPAGEFNHTSRRINSLNRSHLNGTRKPVYVEEKANMPTGAKVWPAIRRVPSGRMAGKPEGQYAQGP